MGKFRNGLNFLVFVTLLWANNPTVAQIDQQTCTGSSWSGADEYFNSWSNIELYPYGEVYCDTAEVDPLISGIPFSAPYYGGNYDYLNIFADGFISFGPRALAEFIPRQTWPNTAYNPTNDEKDPPMVAVYYNDAEPLDPQDGSSLNFRIADPTQHTDPSLIEIYTRTLELLYTDTVAAIPSDTFYPEKAIIVTWDQMLYDRYVGDPNRNTYQVVILTDGTETYTILNYAEVNWIGGADADACDPATGTNEGYPDCFLAQMGFNRGEGLEFTPLPLSSNENQLEIDSNSGTPFVLGRFIYEVSRTTITRGGCAWGDLVAGSPQWPMTVSPSSGIVLGGYEVSVNSVCLSPIGDTVTCRFGSQDGTEVAATIVDEYRAACIAPLLTQTGSIPVFMTINGQVQTHFGEIYVDPLQPSQPDVILTDSFNWFSPDAESLELTWDPLLLDSENTTTQIIDVSLFSYRETTDIDGILNSEWVMLAVLAQDVENTGTWSFLPAEHRCTSEDDCEWHMGAIKLTVASDAGQPTSVGGIWTEVIPLGWYVSDVLTAQYGSDWPSRMCSLWAGGGPASASGPIACPCTPNQASADVGRFRREAQCGDGELTCIQTLSDCYVSIQPSSSGAATRCCYVDGLLQYSGDEANASYSSAVHIDGAAPFGPGLAPLLSHWFADVVPYYWCCAWTDSLTTCENNYASRRPTPDCDIYEPPGIGGSYGDPHMYTLDKLPYTFNGAGEFWMVRTTTLSEMENINIQGRMEPIFIGQGEATVMTAIVVQEGLSPESNTTQVQIELAAPGSQNALSVFVDGTSIDFANPLTESKEFYNSVGDRRTVLTASDPTAVEALDVQMESGVGLSVIAVNRTLSITLALPQQYNGATMGLLGVRNGSPLDDLTNSNGHAIPINSTTETIHNDFGITWMTDPSNSRFTYAGAMNWTYFNNPDFVPVFEPNITVSGVTEEEVVALCFDTTSSCAFDYIVTGDSGFAANTLNQEDILLRAVAASAPVVVCPRLDAAHSFKTVTNGYLQGSVVTFTGCEEGYDMSGTESYECLGHGQWDEYFDFECTDDDDLVLILAIVIPIAVILLIIIIIAVVYLYRHYETNEPPPPKTPVPVGSPVSMTQPNNSIYYTSGITDLSRSTSTIHNESGIHTMESRNSIILTQELRTARPPRPNSQRDPRMHGSSISSDNSYNVAADRADRASMNSSQHSGMLPVYDNRVYQPDNDVIDTRIRVPDVVHRAPPTSDQPPPIIRPKEYYDNLASVPDMDSTSSDSDNEDRQGVPKQTPTIEPRPLSYRSAYPPPQSGYQPRPYSYAAARPYTYTSEYAKPNKGGGISSSFV